MLEELVAIRDGTVKVMSPTANHVDISTYKHKTANNNSSDDTATTLSQFNFFHKKTMFSLEESLCSFHTEMFASLCYSCEYPTIMIHKNVQCLPKNVDPNGK